MSNSETFTLSIAAQSLEAKFYNKKAIVYVEGKDDLNFWSDYFNPEDFIIREVEGCNNLNGKIEDIVNHELKQIVACDSDYTNYMPNQTSHPLVVRTLSHSIECMMYCPFNISETIKSLARSLDGKIEEITLSYDQFGRDIKELVAYDIANNVHKIGIPILDSSSVRFLKNKKSIIVDKNKINDFLNPLKPFFSNIDINAILQKIDSEDRNMRQITRGHFQKGFVTNLIRKITKDINGKEVSIPDDSLYALLVKCPSNCSTSCKERSLIQKRVKDAIDYLQSA